MKTAIQFAKEYYNLPTSKIETVYLESAIKFAEKYASQDRWIKVSERLPEKNVVVLVGHKTDKWICAGQINDDGEWYNQFQDNLTDCEINPTHWQPLPEPPKD